MKKAVVSLLAVVGIYGACPVFGSPAHNGNEMRCLECHVFLPFEGVSRLFHDDINNICSGCHDSYPCKPKTGNSGFSHPVTIKPPFKIPKDMPLDVKKRIGCMTCHVYHDGNKAAEDLQPYLLRRPPGLTFCYTCHENF